MLFATPTAFASQIISLMKKHTDVNRLSPFVTMLPTLLFYAFSLTIPMLVKLAVVRFGHWNRSEAVPNYMIQLYLVNLCSIVIFPTLSLTKAEDIFNFIIENILPMNGGLISRKTGATKKRIECIFMPGIPYTSFLRPSYSGCFV